MFQIPQLTPIKPSPHPGSVSASSPWLVGTAAQINLRFRLTMPSQAAPVPTVMAVGMSANFPA